MTDDGWPARDGSGPRDGFVPRDAGTSGPHDVDTSAPHDEDTSVQRDVGPSAPRADPVPTRAEVVRRALADVGRTVRWSDVALVYGGLVTVGALVMASLPDATADAVTAHASGNLDNLRARPVEALVLSAFVLPHPSNLLLVVALVVSVAYLQRWLGRLAAVIVMVAGQVVASLVVGAVIATGIARGWFSPALAGAEDVGVSYVLACVTGALVARVPSRWRWWYLGALVAVWVLPGVWLRSFTDVGHATALTVGLAIGYVVSRGVEAAASPDGWRPPARRTRARQVDERPGAPAGDERHTPGTSVRDDGPGRPGGPDRR